jgi:hypothetical protein
MEVVAEQREVRSVGKKSSQAVEDKEEARTGKKNHRTASGKIFPGWRKRPDLFLGCTNLCGVGIEDQMREISTIGEVTCVK